MTRMRSGLLFVLLLACSPAPVMTPVPTVHAKEDGPKPPVAKKAPHETAIHGRTLTDDYFWLRNKGSPEVVAHLDAENAYTAAMTTGQAELEQKLYDEMLARIKQDDDTVPVKDGAWR